MDTTCSEHPFAASPDEVPRLFRHIRYGLRELDVLARTGCILEEELRDFLSVYHTRLFPVCATLEMLRYRQQHGVFPPVPPRMEPAVLPAHIGPDRLEQRRKSLFRTLVKACHPDSADAAQPQPPGGLAAVYKAKTISTLWMLEMMRASATLNRTALAPYLEAQRDAIGKAMRDARARNAAIMRSEPWRLKENVLDAALEGTDLIGRIQRRIEAQIAALQQHHPLRLTA